MKLPMPAPTMNDLKVHLRQLPPDVLLTIFSDPPDDSQYLHWDKLRYKAPPPGLSHEQWWYQLKFRRSQLRRPLALLDKDGDNFGYCLTDELLEACEQITRRSSGEIKLPDVVTTGRGSNQYIVNSLIEEAITSSQLEGASTSRRVAKEMLRTGRTPRTKSELMILNNYNAMKHIQDIRNQRLTPELILELHRIVTEDTLDDPADAGRLESPDVERVAVWGDNDQILHMPPSAVELPVRLQALCDFANSESGNGRYMPPVVRAIVLHFMVGYDHYFADGNGRTARALFYWSMLHQGYWLSEYIVISRILKRAPSQYMRSYLLTEDDESDLTYFLLYHVGVIIRALDDLTDYLRARMEQMHSLRSMLGTSSGDFNHRQVEILEQAVKHAGLVVTAKDYAARFRVSDETARTDLANLEHRGLLLRSKSGKAFAWSPTPDLIERLNSAGT